MYDWRCLTEPHRYAPFNGVRVPVLRFKDGRPLDEMSYRHAKSYQSALKFKPHA